MHSYIHTFYIIHSYILHYFQSQNSLPIYDTGHKIPHGKFLILSLQVFMSNNP